MTPAQLGEVHEALKQMLASAGARIETIWCCTATVKCPSRKPSAGMLRMALDHFGAEASETPFVGDQADDLKAAFRAGCPRILVRTGLGSKTLAEGLPRYVGPVEVFDDLNAAVRAWVG